MTALLRLMQRLGADPGLCDEYERDPGGVIARFGLSATERDALLGKDYEAVKRLTGLQDGQFATNSTIKAYDA
jgi:hypothetical protein